MARKSVANLSSLLKTSAWSAVAAAVTFTAMPVEALAQTRNERIRDWKQSNQSQSSSDNNRSNRQERSANRVENRGAAYARQTDNRSERRASRVENRGDRAAARAAASGNVQRAQRIDRQSERTARQIERRGDQRAREIERRSEQRADRIRRDDRNVYERRGYDAGKRTDRNTRRDSDRRNDRRSWDRRDDRRYSDKRDYRRWSRDWRRNNRYDWRQYRKHHRHIYTRNRYYAPYRNYRYSRLSIGIFLDSLFYSSRYWINDPWYYRLPPVYGPYRWVRYYDDALLVNVYTGEVIDVIYDFFW